MKKLFFISLLWVLIIPVFISCKKDKEKDYAAAIKDKVWVGTFNYPGRTEQYYCIQFKADGTLRWSEYYEDYPGTWVINGQQLRISSGIKVVATISDDNKLNNIINDSTADPKLNTGELNNNSGIALDNTVWKGSLSGTTPELVFSFSAGSMVKVTLGIQNLYNGSYTRAGAGIRFGAGEPGFGVIMPNGTEIKGRYVGFTITPWKVTKQ